MRLRPTFALLLLVACGGTTGQQELAYPVLARGEPAAPFAAGGWEVTLATAQVGFGPAYFCATAAASSDLCPAAVSEFARSVTIDALNPGPQPLGDAAGGTGAVRSATYDFAFSWFPTQRHPTPGPGAPGGHSAHFEGQATQGARIIRFVADVDIVPHFQGTRTVQGAPISANLDSEDLQLTIEARPSLWWQGVDFDELALSGEDPVRILPGSRAYEAVVLAMTANARPSLTWSPQQ